MKRILLIEDNQEITDLERDYLEANDFTVDVASDGNTGLDKALHTDCDLVLLDIMLPGKEVTLTNREFTLLVFLAKHPGIVFSREHIFDKVWGLDAIGDTATVVVHINRIRKKIEPDPANPMYIETVWGVGYRFAEL